MDSTILCGSPNPMVVNLINEATRKVLDSNGRNVYTLEPNGDIHQQWKLQRQEDGSCVLQNRATSFVLDSNGSEVYAHVLNDGQY